MQDFYSSFKEYKIKTEKKIYNYFFSYFKL